MQGPGRQGVEYGEPAESASASPPAAATENRALRSRCSGHRSPVTRPLKQAQAWPGPAASPFLPPQALWGLGRALPQAGVPDAGEAPVEGAHGVAALGQATSATGGGAGREAGKGRAGQTIGMTRTESARYWDKVRRSAPGAAGTEPSGGTSEAGHRWRGWELSCPLKKPERDKFPRKGPCSEPEFPSQTLKWETVR